jgi:hypothetical protein
MHVSVGRDDYAERLDVAAGAAEGEASLLRGAGGGHEGCGRDDDGKCAEHP